MKKTLLTEDQKSELALFEAQLKLCLKSTDLDRAKRLAAKIQGILRPAGHETRLMQAKNWLFETALEANEIQYARLGFEGTVQKSSPRTRLHLEATALLAICYLRDGNMVRANQLIVEAVKAISNIKSPDRRKQFHRRLLKRLEEESILLGLIDPSAAHLRLDEVNSEIIKLVMTKSEDQILVGMGQAIPRKSIDLLAEVRSSYVLKLPAPDRKLLPPPVTEESKLALGERASSALRRVAWRAICSPDSEIYKAWSQGLSVVYDKKYIAGAIVASFNSWSISAVMLAASAAALAIKFGAEVFCETFSPGSLMIDRRDKS
jgi:hypothetical protein